MDGNDSINKPFADLSAFIREHRIKVEKEPPPLRNEIRPDDEETVFSEAMQGVRAISKRDNRVRRKKERSVTPDPARVSEEDRLLQSVLADSNTINVTNLPEYMEGYADGVSPLVMEKLRNGEFSVQQVVDLHGLSIESARETFEYFLREAVKKDLKCIKIIHGRGLKSKRAPIIKDYLKTWIVRAMHRKWVTAFSNAVMPEGGPGATYILLRNKPEKKKIKIIG
ncbi:MAG: Smr/MutS family protein [Syntrophorhabdaceae bacterium]|nr:Smr/MutS family endonuclease [Syntrophorhabdaceae bacterium]MDD4197311.1 Smr/MutS family protein [Syntrophorhabdaceae bacterium]HOC47001.1 Smr/MutS family protein [Syntrophorhabdaceae bacterium]